MTDTMAVRQAEIQRVIAGLLLEADTYLAEARAANVRRMRIERAIKVLREAAGL